MVDMDTTVATPQKISSRPEHRPFSPKRLVIPLLVILVIIGGYVGYRFWKSMANRESTDDAYVTAHIYAISSQVSGPVIRVLVDENDIVKKGQLVASIDPRDYVAEVHRVRASIEQARRQAEATASTIEQANLTAKAQRSQAGGDIYNTQASVRAAQAELASAKTEKPQALARLADAKARLAEAQIDEARYRLLANEGAISRQQYEQQYTALQSAKANFVTATQAVSQADEKIKQTAWKVHQALGAVMKSRGELESAHATEAQANVNKKNASAAQSAIPKAQADLEVALLKLSYTKITAPVAGRIGKRNVEVGQQVAAGQLLMNVVSTYPWIDANFKETQLGRIRVGDPVEIKLDAFPSYRFSGHVASLAPATGARFALLPPENATGNFTKIVQRVPVKIIFDDKSVAKFRDRIVPGLSAEVTVLVRG